MLNSRLNLANDAQIAANQMLDRSPRRSVSKWKPCWRGLGQHCRSSQQEYVDVIIWTRFGFLVLVIAFAAFLSTEWIVEAVNADQSYYQNNGWPKIVASVVGGALVSLLGFYLNKKKNERELVDPKTGERMLLTTGGGHTFFFIPMQYWGPIIVVFVIVMAFTKP